MIKRETYMVDVVYTIEFVIPLIHHGVKIEWTRPRREDEGV